MMGSRFGFVIVGLGIEISMIDNRVIVRNDRWEGITSLY